MRTVTLDPGSAPRLDEVVAWVRAHGEPVVVAGEAGVAAVVLPPGAYRELEALRADRAARLAHAAAEVRRVRAEVSARNADLSEAEAEALAVRFAREFHADLDAEERRAEATEDAVTQ